MAVKGGLKSIRKRIRATQNIKKITKAMNMISSVRLRKTEALLLSSKTALDVVNTMIENADLSISTLLSQKEGMRWVAVLTSDRGLCGAYNSNILRFVENKFKDADMIETFGLKGFKFLSKKPLEVRNNENFWKNFSWDKVKEVADRVIDLYKAGQISEVFFYYTKYKSRVAQVPTEEKVFPIDQVKEKWTVKKIYEPAEVVDDILKEYIRLKFWNIFLEALTSEHAMRMKAMDMATRNAEEFVKRLTLQLNKARQEAITKELIDIVNGGQAIESG